MAKKKEIKKEEAAKEEVVVNEEAETEEDDVDVDADGDDAVDADDAGTEEKKKKGKRGVVYLARIPPFMKPIKVRHLLSQYGKVTNLYMEAEDPADKRQRIKRGGTKKTRFIRGWVEFERKKDAKVIAESLNGEKVISNKSNNFWAEDTWDMKYLSGFKWVHLSEKQLYERRIRSMKLQKDMSEARKQNEKFIEKVRQGQVLEKKRSRASQEDGDRENGNDEIVDERIHRKKKRAADGSSGGGASAGVGAGAGASGRIHHIPKQRAILEPQ